MATLPGWRIYVPGHPTEADQLLRAAARTDDRVYMRLCDQSNQLARPITPGRLHLERRGRDATVIATGPLLDPTLEGLSQPLGRVFRQCDVSPVEPAICHRHSATTRTDADLAASG